MLSCLVLSAGEPKATSLCSTTLTAKPEHLLDAVLTLCANGIPREIGQACAFVPLHQSPVRGMPKR